MQNDGLLRADPKKHPKPKKKVLAHGESSVGDVEHWECPDQPCPNDWSYGLQGNTPEHQADAMSDYLLHRKLVHEPEEK